MKTKHFFVITLSGIAGMAGAQLRFEDSLFEFSVGVAFPIRAAGGNYDFGSSYDLGIRLANSSQTRVLLEGQSSLFMTGRPLPDPRGGFPYDIEQWQSGLHLNVLSQPSGGNGNGSGVWYGGGVGVLFTSFRNEIGLYSNESARLGYNLQVGLNFNATTFIRFRYEAPVDQGRTSLRKSLTFAFGYRL